MTMLNASVLCLGGLFFIEVIQLLLSGRRLARRYTARRLRRHLVHLGMLIFIVVAMSVTLAEWYLPHLPVAPRPVLRMLNRAFGTAALLGLAATAVVNGLIHPTVHRRVVYPTLVLLSIVGSIGLYSWFDAH